MKTSDIVSPFIKNCKQLLSSESGEQFNRICFEFMDGGDSMYGGSAPVDLATWDRLSLDEKSILAEKTLNRPLLKVKYPGTYSGPNTIDLNLLIGLDEIQTFECDSMMVSSYTVLLELPKLENLKLDVFGHSEGYVNMEWSVFDALIFLHSEGFKCNLDGIPKFRKELDLNASFGVHPSESISHENSDLSFLTKEFLYERFSK